MNLKTFTTISFLLLSGIPALAFGYGEGEDIPYESRAIHLMTNEARTAPREALADCGKNCSEGRECYEKSVAPLYWHEDLYRAAQFHANMMNDLSCMQHASPCTLVSSVATDFPNTCDGKVACACEGGTAECRSTGTETFERIGMFYKGGGSRAENIAQSASAGKPLPMFNQWLFEESSGSCGKVSGNGHRASILSPTYHVIGVGVSGKYGAQDFGDLNNSEVLTSGSHYQEGEKLWFKTHFFSETKSAEKVVVAVKGECTLLEKTRGSNHNGIYGTSELTAPEACTPYYYEAEDSEGQKYRFPSTGSLLFDCDRSWQSESAASCIDRVDGSSNGGSSDSCSSMPLKSNQNPMWIFAMFTALALVWSTKKYSLFRHPSFSKK